MSRYFCFKRFKVRQDLSAMKVNTDAVLLGSWSSIPENGEANVLDVGTGTGVIALMIAQRLSDEGFKYEVTGIDPDRSSAEEAAINFRESPWSDSLESEDISLQDFVKDAPSGSYDLIVSNPPFFTGSLKTPSVRRSAARHNDNLPFGVIISVSEKLLKTGGMLSIILPANESARFLNEIKGVARAGSPALFLTRQCRVKTLAHKAHKRMMMEFTKLSPDTSVLDIGGCIDEELIINESDGVTKSTGYQKLTGDFYLDNYLSPPPLRKSLISLPLKSSSAL